MIGEYGVLNGGERSLLSVLRRLRDEWEFAALVPGGTEFDSSLQQVGVETIPWSTHGADGQRKSQSEIRQELTQTIQRHSASLVHCNSLSTSRLVGPVAADLKLPSVGHLRDILKLSRKAVSDIDMIDRKLAVSEATRNFHIQQGLDPKSTWVQYNGIDTAIFRPQEQPDTLEDAARQRLASELGIAGDQPTLLFVGQIGMRKGVDVLLEVHARLSRPCNLLIVGQRNSQKDEAIEYERQLHERSRENPNVHWLGRRDDVADLMRLSDLLVHPARQEPLGRVLLEALASGLPVVATNVGGTAEIIPGSLHDLLVPQDDVVAMVVAAERVLSDANLRKQILLKFISRAMDQFSTEQAACGLSDHYRQAIANKR